MLLERERVIGTGYVKAQYAMTLYWAMDDAVRTVRRSREAIAASRPEDDDKTVISHSVCWVLPS